MCATGFQLQGLLGVVRKKIILRLAYKISQSEHFTIRLKEKTKTLAGGGGSYSNSSELLSCMQIVQKVPRVQLP